MSTEEPFVDYVEMTPPAMLEALGDDAVKWAKAFCQTMRVAGWRPEDIDEALMTGWFANAIENSHDVRERLRNLIPVRNATSPWKC